MPDRAVLEGETLTNWVVHVVQYCRPRPQYTKGGAYTADLNAFGAVTHMNESYRGLRQS